MTKDERYMKEALVEAEKALSEGNWPIGCIIVVDDKIIARTHNLVYSTSDKLAHAEMLALREVSETLRKHKGEATLYSTYEPCPMCFGASILSRIKRIVCGIDVDDSGAMYFKEHLPLLFKQDKFSVKLTTGVLAKECYKVFIKGKPTKKLKDKGHLKEL
jgi:tRNA(adenine34) deaminase